MSVASVDQHGLDDGVQERAVVTEPRQDLGEKPLRLEINEGKVQSL